MTRRLTAAASLIAVLAFAPAVRAEDEAAERPSETVPAGTITISLEEPTTLQAAMALIAEKLNLQFVWRARDKRLTRTIGGGITIRGTPEHVLSDFRTLLLSMEVVLMPIGDGNPTMKRTFFAQDVRASGTIHRLRAEPIALDEHNLAQYESEPWRFVTTTIHLDHPRDLRNMRTAVSKLVTGSSIGQVTEVPNASALVVTDFAPNVAAIYRLVRRMDVPQVGPASGPRVSVVKMEYAKAAEIAQLIERLIVREPPPPAPTRRPSKGPANDPETRALRVVADHRTNQIVLSGTSGQVARVEAMIRQLDVPSLPKAAPRPPAETVARVVRLNHLPSVEAQDVLTQFIKTSSRLFDAQPSVIALRSNNLIVVTGTERAHKVLSSLIASLDTAKSPEDTTEPPEDTTDK